MSARRAAPDYRTGCAHTADPGKIEIIGRIDAAEAVDRESDKGYIREKSGFSDIRGTIEFSRGFYTPGLV